MGVATETLRLAIAVLLPLIAIFVGYQLLTPGGGSGDPTTIDGLSFPATLRMSGTTQKLCGGGTRLKFNVVKVYAVGLYFDTTSSESLKAFAGKAAPELAKSSSFYEALISGKFGKTLLLQFHRSVGASTMAEAMRDALAKKLDTPVLQKFNTALTQVPLA